MCLRRINLVTDWLNRYEFCLMTTRIETHVRKVSFPGADARGPGAACIFPPKPGVSLKCTL